MKAVCETRDAVTIEKQFPIFLDLFRSRLRGLHQRTIFKVPAKCTFVDRCFLGVTRIFCSTKGVFYPCERTETRDLFQLGNTQNGVNVQRAIRLAEVFRLLGDCGNCVVKNLCSICPAAILVGNGTSEADGLAFKRGCQRMISSIVVGLEEYSTIMERNPKVVDEVLSKIEFNDWLDDLKYLPTEKQLHEIELGIEELESVV